MKLTFGIFVFLGLIPVVVQGMDAAAQPPAAAPGVGAVAAIQQGMPRVAPMCERMAVGCASIRPHVVAGIDEGVSCLRGCCQNFCDSMCDCLQSCRKCDDDHPCACLSDCCLCSCGLLLETLFEPRCRALRTGDFWHCCCVCSTKIVCCPLTCPCSYGTCLGEECAVALCPNCCRRYDWKKFESYFYRS